MTILSLLISLSAFAMPCDTGYTCKTANGSIKIEIQHCRYDNDMGRNSTVTIDRKEVMGLKQGPGWDGDEVGAFEIHFPDSGNIERLLTVEFSKRTGRGTLRDKTRDYDPAPWKTTRTSTITCVDEG